MYKLIKSLDGVIRNVLRMEDNTFIPMTEDNTDFVEYQKWLALGNKPLPPDEPTLP